VELTNKKKLTFKEKDFVDFEKIKKWGTMNKLAAKKETLLMQ